MSASGITDKKAREKGLWLVMDGTARFDADEATCFEAIGEGVRDQVPVKAARKMWSGHDAVLCFGKNNPDGTVGPLEYVRDVD